LIEFRIVVHWNAISVLVLEIMWIWNQEQQCYISRTSHIL
jgi:hypothetical protein